jgi:hypothetical protein
MALFLLLSLFFFYAWRFNVAFFCPLFRIPLGVQITAFLLLAAVLSTLLSHLCNVDIAREV